MRLKIANEEKLVDVRLRDRLLAQGKITKEQLKKHLDGLPDDSKNAVPLDQEEAKKMQ
ncbi:MAG: hypothetical protein ACOVP4_10330 [Bacteriovoracaceae bacterium]|jgi:hypothetical protein